jgi:hypothetical protein
MEGTELHSHQHRNYDYAIGLNIQFAIFLQITKYIRQIGVLFAIWRADSVITDSL